MKYFVIFLLTNIDYIFLRRNENELIEKKVEMLLFLKFKFVVI